MGDEWGSVTDETHPSVPKLQRFKGSVSLTSLFIRFEALCIWHEPVLCQIFLLSLASVSFLAASSRVEFGFHCEGESGVKA